MPSKNVTVRQELMSCTIDDARLMMQKTADKGLGNH